MAYSIDLRERVLANLEEESMRPSIPQDQRNGFGCHCRACIGLNAIMKRQDS